MSVQDRYAPTTRCFGCGPANELGLRIKSFVTGDELVCRFVPARQHEAFDGVLNGGIIGTLFDCHCNWMAAIHLMRAAGRTTPPCTVTATYSVVLKRPTPSGVELTVRAKVVESSSDRAVVEGILAAADVITATCRGTFVAVTEGHPAFHRW
jgi:acyl-coenzyme A thioesterase PaaI-like protein